MKAQLHLVLKALLQKQVPENALVAGSRIGEMQLFSVNTQEKSLRGLMAVVSPGMCGLSLRKYELAERPAAHEPAAFEWFSYSKLLNSE